MKVRFSPAIMVLMSVLPGFNAPLPSHLPGFGVEGVIPSGAGVSPLAVIEPGSVVPDVPAVAIGTGAGDPEAPPSCGGAVRVGFITGEVAPAVTGSIADIDAPGVMTDGGEAG